MTFGKVHLDWMEMPLVFQELCHKGQNKILFWQFNLWERWKVRSNFQSDPSRSELSIGKKSQNANLMRSSRKCNPDQWNRIYFEILQTNAFTMPSLGKRLTYCLIIRATVAPCPLMGSSYKFPGCTQNTFLLELFQCLLYSGLKESCCCFT